MNKQIILKSKILSIVEQIYKKIKENKLSFKIVPVRYMLLFQGRYKGCRFNQRTMLLSQGITLFLNYTDFADLRRKSVKSVESACYFLPS
jgi:hypothetical protein